MPFTVLDPSLAQAAPATLVGAPLTNVGATLAGMRAEIEALVGERDDVDSDRIDLWINESYTDLYTSLDIDEGRASIALTTVAGQGLYLLPSVVFSLLGVSLVLPERENPNGGRPLEKIDLEAYRAQPLREDDPDAFFRYGQLLVLWPTPLDARVLGVDFRVRPVWLTQDTDSPALGVEWHETIKLGARRRAHSAIREFDLAIAAEQEYIASIRRRKDREAEEDVGRTVGSSAPHKLSRGYRRGYYHRDDF